AVSEVGAGRRRRPAHAGAARCFVVANGLVVGGIRLNLAGREPRGTLTAGTVPEFCRQLERDLLDLVDADSGRRLVQRVMSTDDLYQGACRDELPDVLVEWS